MSDALEGRGVGAMRANNGELTFFGGCHGPGRPPWTVTFNVAFDYRKIPS